MVWNLIGDNTVTTTESYCHQNQGEYHTTTDSTTILTKEYSNGFWNYELLTSEGKKAANDRKETHELKPSLVMNEAKLDDVEVARLWHWRTAHSGAEVPVKMGAAKVKLNEDCYCCDQAKYKSHSYKRNSTDTYAGNEPFWRVFCDGYGGQLSMGSESYEGAVGGFVFVCPTSGTVKKKLYATTEQFPSILYQFLQDVQSMHYCCRELYVDTYSVNLSAAAEEVAALFSTKIVPISAGSPQELAFAESAVRTSGRNSRAMLMGAKHLPAWSWGLADLYSCYVHDVLPQKGKGDKSPFEMRNGKKPDLKTLFIKVFGAPCQYAPMQGAEHKRAKLVHWGWFVGMQWPMVLVLSVDDLKVRSVSRQKMRVYEGAYARFDPTLGQEVQPQHREIHGVADAIPDHVLSVKILSDHKRNADMNDPLVDPNNQPDPPNPNMISSSTGEQLHQGEDDLHVPHHVTVDKMKFLKQLEELKEKASHLNSGTGVRDSIVKAIKAVNDGDLGFPTKGSMKKTKWIDEGKVSSKNILTGKRSLGLKLSNEVSPGKAKKLKKSKKKMIKLVKGTRVKVRSTRFDGSEKGSYSHDKPTWLHGSVISRDHGMVDVVWDIDNTVTRSSAHHLDVCTTKEIKTTTASIMVMLEVGAELEYTHTDLKAAWPKDFIEAMSRSDWRDWVEAVKKEVEGWRDCNTSEEISYSDIKKGSRVIPLGELYTIKRDGRYKYRQYAMGNLLREGVDFGETFASTVSGDGLRWFCSLACACGKEIRGWDATTGYLQTEQRIAVYSYLPSHHRYSDELRRACNIQGRDHEAKSGGRGGWCEASKQKAEA